MKMVEKLIHVNVKDKILKGHNAKVTSEKIRNVGRIWEIRFPLVFECGKFLKLSEEYF